MNLLKGTIGTNQQKVFSLQQPNVLIFAEIDIDKECSKKQVESLWAKEGGTKDIGVNYRGRRRSRSLEEGGARSCCERWIFGLERGRNIEVNYQTRRRRRVKDSSDRWVGGFLNKTDVEVWAVAQLTQLQFCQYIRIDLIPSLPIQFTRLSWSPNSPSVTSFKTCSFHIALSLLLLSKCLVWCE